MTEEMDRKKRERDRQGLFSSLFSFVVAYETLPNAILVCTAARDHGHGFSIVSFSFR